MERRLIDAGMVIKSIVAEKNAVEKTDYKGRMDEFEVGVNNGLTLAHAMILNAPTIDAVELPCKIGDKVWIARRYKCHKRPRWGIVSEMFFTDDMELCIVVKGVARGKWGVDVFATYEEAQTEIERRCKNGVS